MTFFADTLFDSLSSHLPEHYTKWMPGETPLSTLESAFAMVATYLIVVVGIKTTLANQPPLKLKLLFQMHNLLLCIASLILLILFAEEIGSTVWKHGMFYALCADEAWTPKLEFYHIVNYYFKYYELLDTVFLASKKKPLKFLHVYHHAATALLGFASLDVRFRGTASWTITTINLAIHVVMYYYYFRTAMGARIWWKKYLTTMQISQFVVDIGVIIFAGYSRFAFVYAKLLPHQGNCSGTREGFILSSSVIASYLGLFINFYNETFQRTASKRLESKSESRAATKAATTVVPPTPLSLY